MITKTVKSLHRKRNKLLSKFKSTGSLKDRRQYHQAKRKTQKKERQEYWRYLRDVIDANDPASEQPSKQKKVHILHQIVEKGQLQGFTAEDKGKLYAESIDKANILNNQ
jgi:hypothetical protein